MILKIKAKLYQYTGIYLAHKEELEYITSDNFWKRFLKLLRKTNLSAKVVQGILIGLWQLDNGFHRPLNIKKKVRIRGKERRI